MVFICVFLIIPFTVDAEAQSIQYGTPGLDVYNLPGTPNDDTVYQYG
jgi:hypothetical protein